MTKTKRKSSIDNTRLVNALFECVSAGGEFGIDDVMLRAQIVEKDKAPLKQKFRQWHDETMTQKVKQKDGTVKVRPNKILPQKGFWRDMARNYAIRSTGSDPSETVVDNVSNKLWDLIRSPVVAMASQSTRSIDVDENLTGLLDDLFGNEFFEVACEVIDEDEYNE